MQAPSGREPETKRQIFGTHIGDLGIILIAVLCTVIVVLILFSPSPADRLQKAQTRQAQEKSRQEMAERKKNIDTAVASGEVAVGIPPAGKH
ncbi:MAG TPA: hypothetical protein VJP60_06120 [Rhizomicrobium sp.]|nr:hypothetical protein [Rhizomicrobium sp.]